MKNKSAKISKFLVTLCTCLSITACSTLPNPLSATWKQLDENLRKHVLRINHDGLVLAPDITLINELVSHIEEEPLSKEKYLEHFQLMLDSAEKLAVEQFKKAEADQDKTKASEKKPKVKLLIYVHGGLNFFGDTDDRVANLAPIIQQDGDDWHYPIFISWPSSPLGTYGEHLLNIRSGNKVDTLTGAFTAPFVLMTDLMQIGNIVDSVYSQVDRTLTEISHNIDLGAEKEPKIWQQAKSNFEAIISKQQCTDSTVASNDNPKIYWSNYLYPENSSSAFFIDYIARHAGKSLTYPIRSTIGTLYNSAIVESAWRNMKRRTKNIFYPPELFVVGETMKHVEGGRFFKTLLEHINKSVNKELYDYQITIIGHSMGTMVMNHAFKKYRADWIASNALKDIVYMGAAASLQDTMDSVFPVISQINEKPQQTVSFYNLTLNRLAEISETTVHSLLPNGSLLINIDDHLEHPEMPLDRTMGQEANVLAILPVIKQRLGNSVKHAQFKSFDRYYEYGPDKHGSFNQMPFWRKSFWLVDTQTSKPWNEQGKCQFNGYLKNWSDENAAKAAKEKALLTQPPICTQILTEASCK